MQLLSSFGTGSARDQIGIKAARDDILILTDYRYRIVFETSAVNLELKSEEEQDALVDVYQSFLNSLSCPLQILIRTREIDLDNYLNEIDQKLYNENNKVYRTQLHGYAKFMKSLVSVNRILSRNFYIIIPYDGNGKNDFEFVKEQLSLRADIVSKGLQRLGMHSRQLTSLELLNLFYSFYNPKTAKAQPLSEKTLRIMHTVLIGEER